MLDRAAIVRFDSATPEEFVGNYKAAFVKMVKAAMGVKKSSDVVILGVQSEASNRRRPKREALLVDKISDKDVLEVLLLVKKGENSFYERDRVRSILEARKSKISSQLGLTILEVQGDECGEESCDNGRCRDLVVMSEVGI